MISIKAHGILDYIMGLTLIAAPWLFGFADWVAATRVAVILGIATILYSLITAYPLGLASVLPFRIHLMIDIVSGALLLLSPWLFDFSEAVFLPHVVLGIIEIVVVLLTRRRSIG